MDLDLPPIETAEIWSRLHPFDTRQCFSFVRIPLELIQISDNQDPIDSSQSPLDAHIDCIYSYSLQQTDNMECIKTKLMINFIRLCKRIKTLPTRNTDVLCEFFTYKKELSSVFIFLYSMP